VQPNQQPPDNPEDEHVCDVAAEALERIGTPEALTAVAAWRRGQQGIDE